MANERHDASFIVGAILGGLIGGGYALFRVPQAGAETRSQITARGDDMTQRVSATTSVISGQTQDLLTRAAAETAPIRERLTSMRPGGLVSSPTEGGTPRTEIVTEPILTLPDPLEPDPVIVESETAERSPEDAPDGPSAS